MDRTQRTETERKRERDKINQRNKRKREREYIAILEDQVRYLSAQNNTAAPSLLATTTVHTGSNGPEGRADNTSVESESPFVNQVLENSGPDLTDGWLGFQGRRVTTPGSVALISSGTATLSEGHSQREPSTTATTEGEITLRGLTITIRSVSLDELLTTPQWLRLPLITYSTPQGRSNLRPSEYIGSALERMRSTPNISQILPIKPKVLDLLFGGSSNELSNIIFASISNYPMLPPEKFALSWLIYLFFRWYIAPSQDSFTALPVFMRPTACQLCVEHPAGIGALVWPSLRDRIITHWYHYNIEDVIGLLSCTLRLKTSFNSSFIRRENDSEPQVDAAFLAHFTSLDSWGILDKFWVEYPELAEGLDRKVMVQPEHLLPV